MLSQRLASASSWDDDRSYRQHQVLALWEKANSPACWHCVRTEHALRPLGMGLDLHTSNDLALELVDQVHLHQTIRQHRGRDGAILAPGNTHTFRYAGAQLNF